MAAWQFDVLCVPTSRAQPNMRHGDGHIDVADMSSEELWDGEQLPDGWQRQLESILSSKKEWTHDWLMFGPEDGTRIDVFLEAGAVKEVRLRVDAREMEITRLHEVMQFAAGANLSLVTPDGRIVAPDVDALWVELQLSPAHLFVRNPDRFFDGLRRRSDEP